MVRSSVLLLVLVAAGLPGCRRVPKGIDVQGQSEQVELRDTLPPLIADLRTQKDGAREAWKMYETRNLRVLKETHALADDPGEQLLTKIIASPAATLTLLEAFEAAAPNEAQELLADLEKRLGPMPPSILVFGAAREWKPTFQGTLDGRPLLLLNARHADLATPSGRKSGIARALFRLMHEARVPNPNGMGPLARRIYREGAAALAVRMLVPTAQEPDILELEPQQLTALRSREPLIARELLAALDSANEAEVARFFSPDLKDPLLPRGAGRFIADRLYQRLAQDQGSLERPLKLSPAEFLQRTRTALDALAKPPK